jgi:hypothetical protein
MGDDLSRMALVSAFQGMMQVSGNDARGMVLTMVSNVEGPTETLWPTITHPPSGIVSRLFLVFAEDFSEALF